jgi:hypothetical protein
MNYIGTFKNAKCFKGSFSAYRDLFNRGLVSPNFIYIIQDDRGTMVWNNTIIGYYNGETVREVFDKVPYLRKLDGNAAVDQANNKVKTMPVKKPEPQVAKEPETAIKEICFADYSKVVDEFFALLEK